MISREATGRKKIAQTAFSGTVLSIRPSPPCPEAKGQKRPLRRLHGGRAVWAPILCFCKSSGVSGQLCESTTRHNDRDKAIVAGRQRCWGSFCLFAYLPLCPFPLDLPHDLDGDVRLRVGDPDLARFGQGVSLAERGDDPAGDAFSVVEVLPDAGHVAVL